jgi:hypothetical protein
VTWKKGQSGNPGGRSEERLVTDALRKQAMRVKKYGRGKSAKEMRRLDRMADKAMTAAEQGKPWAVQYVSNRLEGMPTQRNENHNTGHSADALFLEMLRRRNGLPPLIDVTPQKRLPAEPAE